MTAETLTIDFQGSIESTEPTPVLRWFQPHGSSTAVLQQQWMTKRENQYSDPKCNTTSIILEWRDVPLEHC